MRSYTGFPDSFSGSLIIDDGFLRQSVGRCSAKSPAGLAPIFGMYVSSKVKESAFESGNVPDILPMMGFTDDPVSSLPLCASYFPSSS